MGKIYSDLVDIRAGLNTRVCNNEMCSSNEYTNSPPILLLGVMCWYCNTNTQVVPIDAG